ncbi:MAG TPA: POTRA domain-containing protein, partial [Thermoanaerobaculia bacterium]|nr:POTRA domain-containing protein [Thermoanaerobaculia bacterium]
GRSGQTTSGGGAGLVGTSLLYQSLGSLIGSRILPFADSFTFDPGLLDTGIGAGPKVTFEKRVSNSVRVLVVYNLDSHESREVVEWSVTRDWTLQLTRDDSSNEYRIDARFRRRYEGHWTWGSQGRGQYASFLSLRPAGAPALPAPPPPPPTTNVQPHALEGQAIARIDLRADARFDTAPMNQYVTLKIGQPVTIRELQSSIKNLFATGNFRDVRVDVRPADGGALVTFSLFLQYRVGPVHFDGLKGGDRARAQREVTVHSGDVFSLDAVDDSAQAIQTELNHLGFLEAVVDPETNFHRDTSIADIAFHVTTGPRAEIANVLIEGDTRPFTTDALTKRMKRGVGRTYRLLDARADADRIKNFLLNRNYRRADADYLGHTYDPATHKVTLRYRASVGPIVKVEVEGVDRRAVRKWLPFRKNQEYSADTIDRAADDIVKGLQERGYYHAAVDTEGRLAGDTWITTFHVSPGIRYRLANVDFAGNNEISDKKLHGLVATSTSGGVSRLIATLFRRPTGVTRQQLSDDRDAIESYYRLQGFSEATVATPLVRTNDQNATMSVEFPITEGPETLLAEVHVEGNEKYKTGDLPKLLLKVGDPLDPTIEREDLVALQTFYAEKGYAEVQVVPRVEISDDKKSAKLAYVVAEGPKVKVDEVIVRGNTYTDSEVVLRTADIEKGDPFSYARILEAQRDLYRIGIFQRVDVQPEQTGTTVGDRDVVIQVEEGKNLTVTGALGLRRQQIGNDQVTEPRVAAAIAHRNLFGTGRYLGLETVFSREEREAFLTFREPFVGRWNVPIQVTAFQTDDKTRPGTHIQQRGLFVEASKVARLRTRWSARYEYKLSKCKKETVDDICSLVEQGLPVADLDRSLLNIQISSVTPTFFWDTRDDIVDPHRGFFTSASVEYAFPFIRADANFTKEFVQGAYYYAISPRNVVALSGRVGLIQPLGMDEKGLPLAVPLSERFTAGGDTSHRGFPLDLLGTLCLDEKDFKDGKCEPTLFRTSGDEVLPLGGNGLLILNAEYRFPIFGTLGGAFFADAGNVYAGSTIDLDRLRYGLGFGLRYLSPVGPLRFDIGWPLQRRVTKVDEFGNPTERERAFSYFITLGYAF